MAVRRPLTPILAVLASVALLVLSPASALLAGQGDTDGDGLWDRFDGTIHSREDHAPKPAPDMLLYAMQMVGAERHETVMIDDSTSGCRAARNAGVRCLGFATMGQGSLLAAEGAEVATSMEDILTLLQI